MKPWQMSQTSPLFPLLISVKKTLHGIGQIELIGLQLKVITKQFNSPGSILIKIEFELLQFTTIFVDIYSLRNDMDTPIKHVTDLLLMQFKR